jgi:hypothetical protein
MGDQATRPLNQSACSAADDDLYSTHADDPRPNALYDEDGERKPLSPTDPGQADLRQEWMDSYKAHGGATEQSGGSAGAADDAVTGCDQRPEVAPLIIAAPVAVDSVDGDSNDDEAQEPAPQDQESANDTDDDSTETEAADSGQN